MSTTIPSSLPPWPQLSYALAKHIVKHAIPETFLTPTELEHFNTALASFQQWQDFIQTKSTANELSEKVVAAFRVRTLLSEQLVPYFFQTSGSEPCCQQLDINSVCQEARELNETDEAIVVKLDIPRNPTFAPPAIEHTATVEEEAVIAAPEASEASETAPTAAAAAAATVPVTPSTQNTETVVVPDGEGEEEILQYVPQNTDHVPLLDIYHTLEFDMAAMIEQRKLEEFHAREEAQDAERNNAVSNNGASNINSTILDDSDGFNLKYLLKGIAENRDKTGLSDRELRALLLEIKPHKSKWASDDKVGQEDLYEALEKMLTDLKNYTEHSTPFLTKVSKRDAPDYYDVIKEPMDLSIVSKKLKGFQYRNKTEFVQDLYLIYDNCLTYNTDPHSEYRKHAIAMRRRTDRLLPRVPDIQIKERPSDDADEQMDQSDDEAADGISSIKLHIKRERSVSQVSRERSVTGESVDEGFHANYSGKHPKKGNTASQAPIDTDYESQSLSIEMDNEKGELQNRIWRDITKKTRARITTDIEKQYQFEFGNRHAITKSSVDMERFALMEYFHNQPESTKKLMRCSRTAFLRWMERHEGLRLDTSEGFELTSDDEEGFDRGFFFARKSEKAKPTDEDDAVRTDLFLPEYSIVPGLPKIEGVPESLDQDEEESDEEEEERSEEDEEHRLMKSRLPSWDAFPESKQPPHGLGEVMESNVKTLENIRSIYKKCNAIRNNTPIDESNIPSDDLLQEQNPTLNTASLTSNGLESPFDVDTAAAHQMMQRTVVQLLSHAGFEGAHGGPLNIMVELMSDYFFNITKTLRQYWDQYSHDMNGEEILMHALHENGIEALDELDGYITDDVERYGGRLRDVKRRLESTYQELATGSVEESTIDESSLFEDDEGFITGLFGEELGQDFFGFKELGLDQEHNLNMLQIPSKLWFGHDQSKLNKIVKHKAKDEPVLKYPPPPNFAPVKSERAFIGLLKPWYQKRLEERPNALEDEFVGKRSSRPRYPPIHLRSANPSQVTSSSKRKTLKDGSNTAHSLALLEEKRKRKRLLEETKALKKKQRLELRAQKLAEKELKKRLREEAKVKQKDGKKTAQ